jgi:hypothetical protein
MLAISRPVKVVEATATCLRQLIGDGRDELRRARSLLPGGHGWQSPTSVTRLRH